MVARDGINLPPASYQSNLMARSRKKSAVHRPSQTSNCDSPTVLRRLDRIEENYELLEDMLSHLESKLPRDLIDPPTDSGPQKPR